MSMPTSHYTALDTDVFGTFFLAYGPLRHSFDLRSKQDDRDTLIPLLTKFLPFGYLVGLITVIDFDVVPFRRITTAVDCVVPCSNV